ncbi:DUF6474 family protein [Corynebacterium diphtheriae]|uniref:DUF6474 family protein n=1 Tax=Corynebacterium diphtheriae TaxID=1717 RepID=UPI000246960A|nr:DUF6474 family protein [Corynebacterium diphtheriae]AEX70872.1 hypothetical protein CDPW8_2229 [Corynebacterium diphtheriae PW8]OKY23106.1 hypothetical protein AO271_09600 [Corynebacterium diphtheriae]UEB38430.1 DUF6474 family protein [Corynebacterium diphtheriae]WLF42670.1 DUF6474 family protein [Corynebacterium diphtheriae]CAB0621036.1 hypothetical protein CIP107554_02233 [Corynebacterium diphtheriae]
MGLFESFRKARAKTKAEIKAAKVKARQEAKDATKLEIKRNKLLAQQEKALLKEERKGLKAKRKHEEKLAKTTLEQLKAGKFNKDNVLRYAGAARTLAPIVLPLIYRGITLAKEQANTKRALRLGIDPSDLARFAGHGAELKARIEGIRGSVKVSSLPKGFVADVEQRLDDLTFAVDNAEYMTPELRQRSHRSIANDLDQLARQIQDKIGE